MPDLVHLSVAFEVVGGRDELAQDRLDAHAERPGIPADLERADRALAVAALCKEEAGEEANLASDGINFVFHRSVCSADLPPDRRGG